MTCAIAFGFWKTGPVQRQDLQGCCITLRRVEGHTMALEMSEPYTSAPCSARGIDSEPVPQPAAMGHRHAYSIAGALLRLPRKRSDHALLSSYADTFWRDAETRTGRAVSVQTVAVPTTHCYHYLALSSEQWQRGERKTFCAKCGGAPGSSAYRHHRC